MMFSDNFKNVLLVTLGIHHPLPCPVLIVNGQSKNCIHGLLKDHVTIDEEVKTQATLVLIIASLCTSRYVVFSTEIYIRTLFVPACVTLNALFIHLQNTADLYIDPRKSGTCIKKCQYRKSKPSISMSFGSPINISLVQKGTSSAYMAKRRPLIFSSSYGRTAINILNSLGERSVGNLWDSGFSFLMRTFFVPNDNIVYAIFKEARCGK